MRTLLGSPALDFMYISASAPDAPPLSETTIGCFIRLFFWIAACIHGAIWTEAAAAGAGRNDDLDGFGGLPGSGCGSRGQCCKRKGCRERKAFQVHVYSS